MRKNALILIIFLLVSFFSMCKIGKASSLFSFPTEYPTGNFPNSIAVGDLDGDGNLDLAVANSHGQNVSVLLGNSGGTFQSAVHFGAGNGAHSVSLGNLDRDGDLDLAVTNNRQGYVSVFLNNTIIGAVVEPDTNDNSDDFAGKNDTGGSSGGGCFIFTIKKENRRN